MRMALLLSIEAIARAGTQAGWPGGNSHVHNFWLTGAFTSSREGLSG